MPNDTKIQDIALDFIRKNVVGGASKWPSTIVGALHPSLDRRLSLDDGELVLVSAFYSTESWYAFTTRRIVSQFSGVLQSLDPSRRIRDDFGNFKGYGAGPAGVKASVTPREVATITAGDSQAVVRFEFETWETVFTYDTNERLASVKTPTLLVVTNIYGSDGYITGRGLTTVEEIVQAGKELGYGQ